jgi:hypothetical protein
VWNNAVVLMGKGLLATAAALTRSWSETPQFVRDDRLVAFPAAF